MMPSNTITERDLARIRESLGKKVEDGSLSMDEASRIYDSFYFSAKKMKPDKSPFKASSSKR